MSFGEANKVYLSEDQLEQLREEGYTMTDPAFTEKELSDLVAECERLHDEEITRAKQTGNERTLELAEKRPFIGQVHLRSRLLARAARASVYQEICSKMIGPNSDLYWNQVAIKPPGVGEIFDWHQDSGYGWTDPLEYYTCWTAFTKAFKENGSPLVVPKSHKNGLIEHTRNEENRSWMIEVDEKDAISVTAEPGQVVVFSSLTYHKTCPNTSDMTRIAFIPQFHTAGVKNEKGELFGDQFPVLRDSQPMGEPAAAAV